MFDSSFGFIIFPSPASLSGGGAVTIDCCIVYILVIIYSISNSLITRQATVLLTNVSVFQAESVTAPPLARGGGGGERLNPKLQLFILRITCEIKKK